MRYFSAVVTDSNDPDQRGRIMAEIPALVDGEWHDWIDCWAPLGLSSVFVPRKDDVITVCESDGGALRWLGGSVEGDRKWPEPFRKSYGDRHGIASADGAACVVLVNGGGVLVLAGAQGTITLATSEDATVEPVPLGNTLNDRITAAENLLASVFSTLSGAAVGPLSGLKAGFDAWGVGATSLPALDLHLSRVTSTE